MKTLALLFLVGVAAVCADEGNAPSPEKYKTAELSSTGTRGKLLKELFGDYDKTNYPGNCTVNLGVSLTSVEFEEDHDVMNTNVWLQIMWNDHRLAWDPEEKGVSILRVPHEKVWVPDLTLYNSINPQMDCKETNVIVYSSGMVLWVPPCRLQSYCNLTLNENPYGEQVCTLKFGSWTFDGITMGLEKQSMTLLKKEGAGTDHFTSRKYKVTQNKAVKGEKVYDCCVEPYYDITFTLGFQRQTPKEIICSKEEILVN